ncbi:hypothetical protein BDZ89DRAFT_251839 [Hymenopellis radicata]|nr:hypothetical protein BDZ89DRAFT_251839 [Hymenopellis radicata]
MASMQSHCATCSCNHTVQEIPKAFPAIPSALRPWLSTNEPPPSDAVPILNECRVPVDTSLARLDADISTLSSDLTGLRKLVVARDALLKQLKKTREAFHQRQQQLAGSVSSLRRFPLEILQHIFFMLIPDDVYGFSLLDSTGGPWAVSRVCTRWRAASTQWSRLWSSFRINSNEFDVLDFGKDGEDTWFMQRMRDVVPLLQLVLARAGSEKLRFHFDVGEIGYERFSKRLEVLLDALMALSQQWECVSFNMPSVLGHRLMKIRGNVPALTELAFNCTMYMNKLPRGDVSEDDIEHFSAFQVAPLLEKVSVRNACLSLDHSILKDFTTTKDWLPFLTIHPCFALQKSPNLVCFSYYTKSIIPSLLSDEPRVTHSNLTSLRTTDPNLLKSLTLPNLESITVGEDITRNLLPYLHIFASFVSASQCFQLTALCLRNCDMDPGALTSLADVLELLPDLEELKILIHCEAMPPQVNSSVDSAMRDVVYRLCETVDDEDGTEVHCLTPFLNEFVFHSDVRSCHEWTFVDSTLVDMLSSRLEDGALVEARVTAVGCPSDWHIFPDLTDDDMERLEEMEDDGFDVSVASSMHPESPENSDEGY